MMRFHRLIHAESISGPTVLPVNDANHAVLTVVGAVDAQLIQQV